MTIGGCLQEIDQRFEFSIEQVSRIGINLIQDIKMAFMEESSYPKQGWWLLFESNEVFILNGDKKIAVELNPKASGKVGNNRMRLQNTYAPLVTKENRQESKVIPLNQYC